MTQDTGMDQGNGMPTSNFWRGAMHIVAGGLAGVSGRDGNDAIFRGAQIGSSLQNSYIKDQQFQQGMRDRKKYNQYRDEQHELDTEYKRKRNDLMGARDADNEFMSDIKMMESLSSSRAMGYKGQSMSRLTARKPTDGSLTYPVNEKDAERIQSISKGHETLSEIDMLVYSMYESESGQSKKASKFAKILGMKHGVSIETGESGNRFIKTKFGAFPLELESAKKIKALYEKDVTSQEAKLSDIWSTRQTAYSGAQKHILGKMDDLNLDSKDKIIRAEEYAKKIASNPVQSKTMDFVHTFDRLVRSKDKEFSALEKAEVVNKLKKSGIEFHMSDKGEPYINAKQFDDAVNRLNPGERVEVIGGTEMVKVDEKLVSLMYGKSGLDNLSKEFTDKAKSDSNKRDQAIAQRAQQEFDMDLQGKMNTQKASVFGKELDDNRKQARLEKDILKKRWSKADPEQIMDTFQFKETEREDFEEQLATEMHRTFSSKSGYMKTFKSEYKELTGNEYKPGEANASDVSIVKNSPKLQKIFGSDTKTTDRISKRILSKLVRDRKANLKKNANDRLDAEFKANKAEERRVQNQQAVEKKTSVLDSILSDGEN